MQPRKSNRLTGYDYTQNGAYFVTICTKDREPILWDASHSDRIVGDGFPVPQAEPTPQGTVGDGVSAPQERYLSWIGVIVRKTIAEIPEHFPSATVDSFAIMPDHMHLVLFLHRDLGTGNPSPTMGNVVGWLKYQTTKTVNAEKEMPGEKMWQRFYYDHVIRNERDYVETMRYIDNNLLRQIHHIPKGM